MDELAENAVAVVHRNIGRDRVLGLLDLDELLSKDHKRRVSCTNRRCTCYDGTSIDTQLRQIINGYPCFFKPKANQWRARGGRNEVLKKVMEARSVREVWADTPAESRGINRAIRKADLNTFVTHFATIFEVIFNADQNKKAKGPDSHERRCIACYKWLQWEFSTLRTDTIKKIVKHTKQHNIHVAALTCFALQHKFTDHPAFEKPKTMFSPMNDVLWNSFKKHLGREHARDRRRELKDFKVEKTVTAKIAEQYKKTIEDLKKEFPNFFLADGNFDNAVFEQADYGELYDCSKCGGDYADEFLIKCKLFSADEFLLKIKLTSMGIKLPAMLNHRICRTCLRNAGGNITMAHPQEGEAFHLKIPCFCLDVTGEVCKGDIMLDETSFTYFSRNVRAHLYSAALDGLLQQHARHIPNE